MSTRAMPPLPGVDPATAPQPEDPDYAAWIERVVFTPEGVDRSLIWEQLHRTPTERLRAVQNMIDALRPRPRHDAAR